MCFNNSSVPSGLWCNRCNSSVKPSIFFFPDSHLPLLIGRSLARAGLCVPVVAIEAPPDSRRGGRQTALRIHRERAARRRLRNNRWKVGLAHREGSEEPGDRRLPDSDAQGGRRSAGVPSGVAGSLLRQQRGTEVEDAGRDSAADDEDGQKREEEVEDVYYSVIFERLTFPVVVLSDIRKWLCELMVHYREEGRSSADDIYYG